MKYYVGVKREAHRNYATIYKSDIKPTTDRHPLNHGFCFGPYRLKREAVQVAMFQGYYIVAPRLNKPAPVWDGVHNSDFPMEVYA